MIKRLAAVSTFVIFMTPLPLFPQNQPDQLSETYRDWVVRCDPSQSTFGSSAGCEMSQDLRQEGTGQRVIAIGIQVIDETSEGLMTVVAPFGLRLSDGLRITKNETNLATTEFETCLPTGCIARLPLLPNILTAFQQGSSANVTMTSNFDGDDVSISISLIGFTAAWERLISFQ